MAAVDLITQQKEAAIHHYGFYLWPAKWEAYAAGDLSWETRRLESSERGYIPDEPGIYTFVLQPALAGHPACSYLMYVGKTHSLRTRFGQYLSQERRESGRPKVFRLLNLYEGYLWFCITRLPPEAIDDVEDALILAYIPPINDRYPAEFGQVIGAF